MKYMPGSSLNLILNLKTLTMKHYIIQSIKSKILHILALICFVMPITAQTEPAQNFAQFLYPNFTKSVVKLKTGEILNALMNYNTVTEKMTFYQKGVLLNMNNPENADTIFIQDSKFVFVEGVFYEILLAAPVSLFIQHKSALSTSGKPAAYGASSQTASSTSITKLYNDKTYNLKLPDDVTVTPTPVYWVRTNDGMQKFTTERQFLKIFPTKEVEVKKFIKLQKTDFKDRNSLIKLVAYCNELFR